MYPSRFRYEAPRTLEEAIAVLAAGEGEAKVLAGGQSLVPMMKLRFANPALLVDINNLPGLDYHRTDADGTLRVGALCRHATIEHSELVASTQPTMAAAAHLVADPIVRNRGTFVGSLCHADPQGDWAAVLTALDGSVVAQGPGGRRTLGIRDFVVGPFQTAMSYDELAVEAVVPPPKAPAPAATSSSSGGSATSPPPAAPWPWKPRAARSARPASRSPASAAPPSTPPRPPSRWSGRPLPPRASPGPPSWPPPRPGPTPTTAAARRTSGTSSARS
ncbi:MAG: FAD binding domain-containing protein [Nocardioides sp.]